MKKEYISPLATEVTIETVNMLAGSVFFGSGSLTPDNAWSNENRGEWGNLWKQ